MMTDKTPLPVMCMRCVLVVRIPGFPLLRHSYLRFDWMPFLNAIEAISLATVVASRLVPIFFVFHRYVHGKNNGMEEGRMEGRFSNAYLL
jgi:hypothetical protein